jgi:hypothetical protein
MAKRKKLREISKPLITDIVGFTAEEHEEHYKRDYEFNKPAPVRTVASGWAYKYANEGNTSLPPKEIALIKGTPHRFKGVRTGNVYSRRQSIRRSKIK